MAQSSEQQSRIAAIEHDAQGQADLISAAMTPSPHYFAPPPECPYTSLTKTNRMMREHWPLWAGVCCLGSPELTQRVRQFFPDFYSGFMAGADLKFTMTCVETYSDRPQTVDAFIKYMQLCVTSSRHPLGRYHGHDQHIDSIDEKCTSLTLKAFLTIRSIVNLIETYYHFYRRERLDDLEVELKLFEGWIVLAKNAANEWHLYRVPSHKSRSVPVRCLELSEDMLRLLQSGQWPEDELQGKQALWGATSQRKWALGISHEREHAEVTLYWRQAATELYSRMPH